MAQTIWRGHMTFGLVSIPVRLFRAARAEKVSFRQLYRAPAGGKREAEETDSDEPEEPRASVRAPEPVAAKAGPVAVPRRGAQPEPEPEVVAPVRRAAYVGEDDKPLSRNDLVKGYEYGKNQYVVIEEEELKKLEPKTATEMQILEFVKLAEVDPVYLESSYYLIPEEAGAKAYALLLQAMRTSGYVAVAQVAMHRREHVVIVRPGRTGIILHTMFFDNEVRSDQEYRADPSLVSEKELKLATMLVAGMETAFDPAKYHDTYREKVEAMIAAKMEGKEIATAAPTKKAEVVDILQALQESLAARKPAGQAPNTQSAEETSTAKKPRKKAAR